MRPLLGLTQMILPSLFYVNYSGQQPWLLTYIGQCLTLTVCQVKSCTSVGFGLFYWIFRLISILYIPWEGVIAI